MSLRVALSAHEAERLGTVKQLAGSGAAGVQPLVELLTDSSWAVRREVVIALGSLGEPATRALCTVLRERRDSEARIAAAVDALVASSSDVLAAVTALTSDADPAIAADGAQVLGRRRSPRAVPVLAPLVAHADDNVAVAAIEALGRIGGPLAIDALIAAVRSGNFFRTFPAIDVLGRCGDPRAIPQLASLRTNPMYQLEVARALGMTGESVAVRPLMSMLSSPSEAVVRVAAVALTELQARHLERYGHQDAPLEALKLANVDPVAIARLRRSLSGATPEERLAIASLLGSIGDEEAAVTLRSMLELPGAPGEAAAVALKRLSKIADPHLRQALREGDSALRQRVLPLIARASAEDELVACLHDESQVVRALACDALGRVGATGAVAALFGLLTDQSPRVVQSAIGAIQSLGSAQTKNLALQFAADTNPALRARALRIVSYFGFPEALPVFLFALKTADLVTQEVILTGLAQLEAPEAVAVLIAHAKHENEKTRAFAVRALGQTSLPASLVEGTLLAALNDSSAWVRYYACQALGRLEVESAAEAIVKRLAEDDAGQVRVAAIEALSHFQSASAQYALQHAAKAADPDIQRAALIGLGLSERPEVTPMLLEAVGDSDPSTRLVALSALAGHAVRQPEALSALTRATKDSDENVRAAALGFLAAVPGPGATQTLAGLLAAGPADRAKVLLLLSSPGEGRVEGLSVALKTADDELAGAMASALARLHSTAANEALLQAMTSPNVAARRAAASSLASLRTPVALASLSHAAENDTDPQVRQICSVLLSL